MTKKKAPAAQATSVAAAMIVATAAPKAVAKKKVATGTPTVAEISMKNAARLFQVSEQTWFNYRTGRTRTGDDGKLKPPPEVKREAGTRFRIAHPVEKLVKWGHAAGFVADKKVAKELNIQLP